MKSREIAITARSTLLASAIGICILSTPLPGQTAQQQSAPAAVTAHQPVTYRPSHFPKRAGLHYGLVWGVDALSVKLAESGEMVRFTYRVLDADKAKTLNDKKLEPYLIDPKAHVKLVVPSLEKVGQLRQSSTPEAGRAYWMAFSNKGRRVKRGDLVSVVIGQFHADGLIVE